MSNHVDGEIWVPTMQEKFFNAKINGELPTEARVPVEPTDLDYRTAALNAALEHHKSVGGNLLAHAKYFERYLRGEAA